MDTIIFVTILIGSSLGMALLFTVIVLSPKGYTKMRVRNYNINQKQINVNSTIKGTQTINRAKPQTLVELKRKGYLNNLVGMSVMTCEKSEIGCVTSIDEVFITIQSPSRHKYVVPTYYLREYDQERIIIDISTRYLDHYLSERNLQ